MKVLRNWSELPKYLQTSEVKKYYDILDKRRGQLAVKRAFDVVVSSVMLVLFLPLIAVISVAIKLDSKGPVFYRQVRVTQYGRKYKIHKFRSMKIGADKASQVTVNGDNRITKVGKFIRKYRLDEISQLIDVLNGDMSFVGTRPEVVKYVRQYTPEMMATLLLPAGITSQASICYKDEAELLDNAKDTDKIYVEEILPSKMQYNLKSISDFSIFGELKTMFTTVFAVLGVCSNDKSIQKHENAIDLNGNSVIIKDVHEDEKDFIDEIVDIHLDTFQGFFLTFMGKGFLKQLYLSYVDFDKSGLMAAVDENGNVIGFLAYSSDYSGLYKYMIKHRLFWFAFYSMGAFFRKPKVFMRLVRAFLKPSESKRKEAYVELASIGVSPKCKSKGTGSKLISSLKKKVDFDKFSYISLETDAENNDAVRCFYEKNEFILERTYSTAEGRKMAEYRFKP